MRGQLALKLQLRDEASFANYWVSAENTLSLKALENFLTGDSAERFFYLWGLQGSGKTHLALASAGRVAGGRYLPLSEHQTLNTEILDDEQQVTLWCLDDVDWVAGDPKWEEALFHFYNQVTLHPRSRLLVTASQPPVNPAWALADLRSRFAHAWIFQLHGLSDEDKLQALMWRAKRRGIVLSLSVAQYLLNHGPRDMGTLLESLEQLDEASLAAKRNWTIPFVKDILKI